MNTKLMAAIGNGDNLVNSLIWIVGAGLIFWLVWWLIDFCGLPQPFNKVAKILVAVVAVVVLITFIARITGVKI